MTSGQKIAFSLLTTIVLVAGFVVTAQSTKLFKIIDDRYYSQTQVKDKNEHLNSVAQSLNSYITNVLTQLEEGENAYVRQDCVRSYMDQNPSEALQQDRRDLTAQLFNDIPSLSGIRLVDKNGKSLHYSSYDNDVLKTNGSFKTYKNYPDVAKDSNELEFNLIKVNENSPVRRVLLDSEKNRIIMAIPFNWIGDVYSGSMFFYFNFKDVEQDLVKEKIITYGENIKLVSENFAGGIIIDLPNVDQKEFLEPVVEQWRKNTTVKTPEKILEMKDGRFWLMLSSAACEYVTVAGVYTSDTFQLPQELIWVIYGCVAITIFLISFLLFSFKRNSEAVIKRRLKKIQYGIIKEYLDNKEKIEWSSVVKQLKTRKDDLSGDIYSSLGVHSKKQKKHLDEFLEKSWAEIFEVLEGTKAGGLTEGTGTTVSSNGQVAGITMDQLRNMLEEVLQETSLNINVANIKTEKKAAKKPVISPVAAPVDEIAPVEELEDVEEIEDLDDVEEVDSIEEVEELDDVEEIEDAEEVEELDDVEEVDAVEDVEDLDEVEEIEDAEEVEDLDDVEEVEELDDVEEVDAVEDVEDLDEVEEIEDAEEVEDLDDVEEVEELDDVEEVDAVEEVEELDEVEEIEDAEEAEELDDVEEVEDLGDVEESGAVTEVEELDEVEEIEDAEAADELNTVEELEETEELEELQESENVTNQFQTPDNPIKFAQALNPIGYEYIESNETFVRSDIFASTSDVFAEELILGPEYVEAPVPYVPLDFIIYDLPKLAEKAVEEPVNEPENLTKGTETTVPESVLTKGTETTVPETVLTKGTESTVPEPVVTKVTESTVPLSAAPESPEPPVPPLKKARLGLLAAASAIVNNEFSLKDNSLEDVEELKSSEDFSMTQFGSDLEPVQDLESAPQDSIVEKEDGLFEIANDLEFSEVKMDKSFQSLVDSVLK